MLRCRARPLSCLSSLLLARKDAGLTPPQLFLITFRPTATEEQRSSARNEEEPVSSTTSVVTVFRQGFDYCCFNFPQHPLIRKRLLSTKPLVCSYQPGPSRQPEEQTERTALSSQGPHWPTARQAPRAVTASSPRSPDGPDDYTPAQPVPP